MPAQKFQLDLTGIDPANKITDELHNSIDTNSGIVIPEFKNFFTESLVVKNSLGDELDRDIDYVPIEFNQDASLRTGKEVCNAIILLTNLNSTPISLTYQVFGGPDTYSAKNLIETYLAKVPVDSPVPYDGLLNKPLEFPPTHHLHDADEMYGLEYIVNKLRRIEQAMYVGSFPTFKDLMSFIDTSLLKIQTDMDNYLNQNMDSELTAFKSIFTKEFLGIENVENLRAATEKEGEKLGELNFLNSNITENKYVLIETLIGFKKTLYKNLIRKDLTGLDLMYGTYMFPYEYSIRDLRNRSTFNAISKSAALQNGITMSDNFYPQDVLSTSEVVVSKLSNDLDSNDSDLFLIDQVTLNLYWGTAVEQLDGFDITWKKITEEKRLAAILETLQAHIDDKNNPHELNKNQINLNLVENLPIVTKEELDNMESVRSYLTFESLVYFSRKHLLQNGPPSPVPADSRNKFIIDNAVVVYSPAGKPYPTVVDDSDPKVHGLDGTFPVNTTIGWSINNGAKGTKFRHRYGMIGGATVEKELTLSAVGNYIGYLPTGGIAGTIQSIFTFSDNTILITNTLVQETNCEAPEPPPAPTPTPTPTPTPPAVPPTVPGMSISPASISVSGEVGVAINYLGAQVSSVIPTGATVLVGGGLAPGLTLIVATTAVAGTYPVSLVGTPTTAGSFSGTVRIIGADNKHGDITVNANIAAAKVPNLSISTNKTGIMWDTVETITVTASGGKPNSSIGAVVYFTYLSGSYKVLTANVSISMDAAGNGSGTCKGGNPGAKYIPRSAGVVINAYTGPVNQGPALQGGLPLGKWQIQAKIPGSNPLKESNKVTRTLYGVSGGSVSMSSGL